MPTELVRIEARLGARKPMMQHIITSADTWLWVDAGVAATPDEWILPELERRGLVPPPRNLAVITHADVDHFGGMSRLGEVLPSLVVIAHASDRRLLTSLDTLMAERYDAFGDGGIEVPRWRADQLRERAGRAVRPTLAITDEAVVTVGDEEWRIIRLPGHSEGHLGVWNPETGVLIAGDAVMGWGVIDGDAVLQPPHYIDVDAYRATIDRIASLGLRELRLSHEELIQDGQIGAFLDDSRRAVDVLAAAVEEAAVETAGETQRLRAVCDLVQARTDQWSGALPSAYAGSVEAHLKEMAR
jgi:glyoxylase-like metal-dependent hydrolase (beta-lactamase superfamily II)